MFNYLRFNSVERNALMAELESLRAEVIGLRLENVQLKADKATANDAKKMPAMARELVRPMHNVGPHQPNRPNQLK